MNYHTKLIISLEDIDEVYQFMKSAPLDYPDYDLWLEKCKCELKSGYKSGFYARNLSGAIVGSIIFQPCKQDNSILEIKNIRVDLKYMNQGIGSTLYGLSEKYAETNGFRGIQTDTHLDNFSAFGFFRNRGFRVEKMEALYEPSKLEAVLFKEL